MLHIVHVFPLPAVSGPECVRALQRAGFAVTALSNGSSLLEGRGRVVTVPHVRILDYDVLHRLLSAAGLTSLDFLDFLNDPISVTRLQVAAT